MSKCNGLTLGVLLSVLSGCDSSTRSDAKLTPTKLAITQDDDAEPPAIGGPADDQDASRLIERVILAHGGRAALQKTRIGTSLMFVTGVPGLPGGDSTVTRNTEHFDLPRRLRREGTAYTLGGPITLRYVVTEEGSWKRTGDQNWQPNPLPPGAALTTFPAGHFDILLSLAEVPEEVRVSWQESADGKLLVFSYSSNRGDADIFFDPRTYLAHSTTRPVHSIEAGKIVETRTTFKDYKKVQGVWVPMTTEVFQEGKRTYHTVVKEIQFLEKLDGAVFNLDGT